MLLTTENIRALNRGLITQYKIGAESYTPQYSSIATRVTSTKASNVYKWLGTFPVLERFTGESKIENLEQTDWEIKNEEWDKSIAIAQKDIERDDLATHGLVFQGLGRRGSQLPDKLVFDLLQDGFTKKDYTGKNFFDYGKQHSPRKAGTFSNKGTKVLAASSLKEALTQLRNQKDPEGYPVLVNDRITLVVPPTLEWLAKDLLEKETNRYGEQNILRGACDYIVSGWLSGPAWYLIAHDPSAPALIYQEERAPGVTALTQSADNEHLLRFKEFLYNVYGRASAGYGFPQRAYGSTGVDPVDDGIEDSTSGS